MTATLTTPPRFLVRSSTGALYGPFGSAEAAKAWALHPNRTPEVRFDSRVVPVFGGLLLQDEQ